MLVDQEMFVCLFYIAFNLQNLKLNKSSRHTIIYRQKKIEAL